MVPYGLNEALGIYFRVAEEACFQDLQVRRSNDQVDDMWGVLLVVGQIGVSSRQGGAFEDRKVAEGNVLEEKPDLGKGTIDGPNAPGVLGEHFFHLGRHYLVEGESPADGDGAPEIWLKVGAPGAADQHAPTNVSGSEVMTDGVLQKANVKDCGGSH